MHACTYERIPSSPEGGFRKCRYFAVGKGFRRLGGFGRMDEKRIRDEPHKDERRDLNSLSPLKLTS